VEKKDSEQKKEVTKHTQEIELKRVHEEPTKETPTNKRQRRWGQSTSSDNSISTDTIKEITASPEVQAQKRKREEAVKAEVDKKVELKKVEIKKVEIKKIEIRTPTSAKSSTKVQKKEEEPEIRQVPPSKKPVSNILFITNFVRPFTKQAVEDLLKQTGKVKDWGMDAIKSRCFVIYETEGEAETTRNALHNLIWPPSNKSKLQVDFSNENDAKKFVTADKPKEKTPPPVEEKVITLDDLFKKTVAKPPIYYLPLSESEIEAKKKAAEAKPAPLPEESNHR